VPVLTTDVGIVPELIRDGENSFMVERTLPAFKEQLQTILDQREQLPEMGAKLRKRMENEFDWRHLIVQWTDFFQYALELQRLDREGQL
jgi:glycosyltransferase involved in cell wall biosynthesis